MNEKEKAALVSIGASAGLTAAKAAIGLLTGSLAILSEAGHSLIDLAATVPILVRDYEAFCGDFAEFFPQLIAHVAAAPPKSC